MSNLWDQLALIESNEWWVFKAYIDHREEQCWVQLLMAIQDDFDVLSGTILHHTPLPGVNWIINELLAEEIRLKSHSHLYHERGNLSPSPSVFIAPFNKKKPQGGVGTNGCSFCKENGHWKTKIVEVR